MGLQVDGSVEFYCFETGKTYETMQFTIYCEVGRVKLESADCPFDECEFDGHWRERVGDLR